MERQDFFKVGMVVVAALFLFVVTEEVFPNVRDYGV